MVALMYVLGETPSFPIESLISLPELLMVKIFSRHVEREERTHPIAIQPEQIW